jgi:uncharacterized protein YjbI with pentapeptide repeats
MTSMIEEFPAAPRSTTEVLYFIGERPCPRCSATHFSYQSSDYPNGKYVGVCAGCTLRREFHFPPAPGIRLAPPFTLTPDAEPTRLFTAAELRAIADRELALLSWHPEELSTLAELDLAQRRLVKVTTTLNELVKCHPGNAAVAAEASALAGLWDTYQSARSVVDAKPGAHPKPLGIDARMQQHRRWLARGRVGDGQIVFRNEPWHGVGMPTSRLHHAIFEDSKFERVDFSYGEMHDAVMTRTRFLACDMVAVEFDRATLEDTDMAGSSLALGSMRDTTVRGGDWQRILGGRSTWRAKLDGVDLRGASLRDMVLDDTVFARCDLRGADFSRKNPILTTLGTARRTRFVDCDLRGINVEGWRLDGAVFERCKLHGLVGTPVFEGDVQVIEADLSAEADGSVLGGSWPR